MMPHLADLTDLSVWASLATLAAMEVVLGLDNVIFIAILVSRLPAETRERTRRQGLLIALVLRIGLLSALSWLMGLTAPLVNVGSHHLSGRDLILLGGGLFLMAKSGHEIHVKLEGANEETAETPKSPSMTMALAQIVMVDIVFSLDSVITAIGMAQKLWVMVAAMFVAMGVMLKFAGVVGEFVDRHPTMKILALSFLLLIGVLLVAEAFGQPISKGYVYFAMAFSFFVEILNLRLRKKAGTPVRLHGPHTPPPDA